MSKQSAGRPLRRSFDHLGNIEKILRDLQGYDTLAYELIQNADDAPNATSITFNVTDTSLIVDNDGIFSDCGHINEPECPWKGEPSIGHRCDFHRFCIPAGSDKRREEGTTGAFGVGFIAVYQVTDRPQVISNGRHWILREEYKDDERIWECGGCPDCQNDHLPGTRFILPWADDPSSQLRRVLHVSPVSSEIQAALVQDWEVSLLNAMIFLKRLLKVEIHHNGELTRRFDRLPDGQQVLVTDSKASTDHIWTVVVGDFSKVAQQLHQTHPDRIEEKRSSEVKIAIPETQDVSGRLYACLPTQHSTGLPFHIDADFFPGSDRKKVVLEEDYQSRWNRAAIEAAAVALRDAMNELPKLLGSEALWNTMVSSYKIFQEAANHKCDRVFGEFWGKIGPVLRHSPIALTEREEWHDPPQVLFLGQEEEEEAIPVLDALGIDVLHRKLRPYIFQLPRTETLGMSQLDIEDIVEGLRLSGLTQRVEISSCPPILRNREGLRLLWREITRILQRTRQEARRNVIQELTKCAIALGRDDALWPCNQIFQADAATVDLFGRLSDSVPFLGNMDEDGAEIAQMCQPFNSKAAIGCLEILLSDGNSAAGNYIRGDPAKLLRWFESRRNEVLGSEPLKQSLAGLRIYPGPHGELKSLKELALPGDFEDPIGITDIIDLKKLGGRRDFLIDLGKKPLSFPTYAREYLPAAFTNRSLGQDKKRAAIFLLAERLGEIRDDDEIRDTLVNLPMIELQHIAQQDLEPFVQPDQVYFPECQVENVLGKNVMIACLPETHRDAVWELYRWLGVEDRPRFHDILERIDFLTESPPNNASVIDIQRILLCLGERYQEYKDKDVPTSWGILRTKEWLPVRGRRNKWFSPQSGMYSIFRSYLFESQGTFLDIEWTVQRRVSDFLEWLGVKDEPDPPLVVAHLLHCAESGFEVNKEVYSYLNDNSAHGAIAKLINQDCLLMPNGEYVAGYRLFRADHLFGRYRYRLSPEMARYDQLLSRLGVRDTPGPEDAIRVLGEIRAEWGHNPLNDEAYAICINCWQMLAEALDEEAINSDELIALEEMEVVPNNSHILMKTRWMLFDDRAGIAHAFGNLLQGNLIVRLQGAWPAMETAGVRTLTKAVDIKLLECNDPVKDDHIGQRIEERHALIARVVESHGGDSRRIADFAVLTALECFRVNHLVIKYELDLFEKRIIPSNPLTLQALLCKGDRPTLYFVSQDGRVPWTAIAKEIALALVPDADPGQIASGIKDVLSAETKNEAQDILDELGFAPLNVERIATPVTGEIITQFGGIEGETDHTPVSSVVGEQQGEEQPTQVPPDSGDALTLIFGPSGVPEPTPMPTGLGGFGGSGNITPGSKLRTYVLPPDHVSGTEDPSVTERRKEIDAAGVEHVVEYERSNGRLPTEMPHTHEGWDIESKDAEGNVIRYIEVKSVEGNWNLTGVGLSRPQFEKAKDLGERYWLYIVEHTLEQDYRIYRIQNPAARVNQFLYDDGWRQLSEMDE